MIGSPKNPSIETELYASGLYMLLIEPRENELAHSLLIECFKYNNHTTYYLFQIDHNNFFSEVVMSYAALFSNFLP